MTTYKHTRNNIPELLGQIKELRDDGAADPVTDAAGKDRITALK